MSKKVLFVIPNKSSFVEKDIAILRKYYEVTVYEFKISNKLFTPFSFLKQLFFLFLKGFKFDVGICQIAAYHSFLPAFFFKISGKPFAILLAGTDCAKFPSIRYGNFNKPLLGLFTKWSIKLATHLAPKHESLISFKYDYTSDDLPYQGLKHLIPGFKKPYTVIENGYDANAFRCNAVKASNSFITVAGGIGTGNIKVLKGIDLVMEAAKKFPDFQFTLVGVKGNSPELLFPSNIKAYPPLPNNDLAALYSRHQFYFQLSMSEGFPNAICEAMLCECVPIGSNVNAIPDIIGATGYILNQRNKLLLFDLIQKAVAEYNTQKGKAAREWIIEKYSLEKREKKLIGLVNKLLVI